MYCPTCNKTAKVTDTRQLEQGHHRQRRYQCEACQLRFTTREMLEDEMENKINNLKQQILIAINKA